MKLKPNTPRTTAIGGKAAGVRWRYDPVEHADGMEVSPEVGRVLLASGHWAEVSKPKKHAPKVAYNVDDDPLLEKLVKEKSLDDRLSE